MHVSKENGQPLHLYGARAVSVAIGQAPFLSPLSCFVFPLGTATQKQHAYLSRIVLTGPVR